MGESRAAAVDTRAQGLRKDAGASFAKVMEQHFKARALKKLELAPELRAAWDDLEDEMQYIQSLPGESPTKAKVRVLPAEEREAILAGLKAREQELAGDPDELAQVQADAAQIAQVRYIFEGVDA